MLSRVTYRTFASVVLSLYNLVANSVLAPKSVAAVAHSSVLVTELTPEESPITIEDGGVVGKVTDAESIVVARSGGAVRITMGGEGKKGGMSEEEGKEKEGGGSREDHDEARGRRSRGRCIGRHSQHDPSFC